MKSEKRIGALFQRDIGGHSGDILRAQALSILDSLGDIPVIGLYRLGETQIAEGVFVGAVDQRGLGQRFEA